MEWIDVHTHLNMLEKSPEETIKAARNVGVERIITIGTEPEDHDIVESIAAKHFPVVACTLGVHPHEAKKWTEDVSNKIKTKLNLPHVVAVGEIGLDYFYEHTDREKQKEVFRQQMSIAEEFNLPVEVHTRDAEEDTLEIVNEFKGRVRGIFHCFSSSRWLAEKGLDAGWNISISGIVTFKNADELREIVKFVPIDRIHVETDAPYLAPVPQRGKKNTPEFVVHTAEKVAELKGMDLRELSHQVKKNALDMFPKLSWH